MQNSINESICLILKLYYLGLYVQYFGTGIKSVVYRNRHGKKSSQTHVKRKSLQNTCQDVWAESGGCLTYSGDKEAYAAGAEWWRWRVVGDKIRNVTGVRNPNAQSQLQVNYIQISGQRSSGFQSSPLVLRAVVFLLHGHCWQWPYIWHLPFTWPHLTHLWISRG